VETVSSIGSVASVMIVVDGAENLIGEHSAGFRQLWQPTPVKDRAIERLLTYLSRDPVQYLSNAVARLLHKASINEIMRGAPVLAVRPSHLDLVLATQLHCQVKRFHLSSPFKRSIAQMRIKTRLQLWNLLTITAAIRNGQVFLP
jgi:hypothetical protein